MIIYLYISNNKIYYTEVAKNKKSYTAQFLKKELV
jgi:hypothetical protein